VLDGRFRGALGLGASLASGNTRASNLALSANAVRATVEDKVSLYALALRTSASGATTGDTLRLGGRYDYNINPLMFGFGGLDLERNKLANLKLRSQTTAGLGYHFISTATTTWDLFGGLAFSADKFLAPTLIDGQSRSTYSYPSLMLAEESSHVLSPTTTAKQRLVIYPNLKDRGEFRATLDAGVAVAMSSNLSLNVGLGAGYNSQPGDTRKKLDTLITTGVSVKLD
jgi:putative salt-induced outer membrane protein